LFFAHISYAQKAPTPPTHARTKAGGVDPRVRAFIRRGEKKKREAPVYG
jgi:hypothetical protein